MGILDIGFVRRTRRNHAIEHAAVHILSSRHPGVPIAGRSDAGGFHLYGDVEGDEVRRATEEAIERLETEPELAVHPYCGTNLVVGMAAATGAALLSLASMRADRRAPRAALAIPWLLATSVAAAAAARPAGPWVQRRWMTLPDAKGARVGRVSERSRRGHRFHRVEIASASS